MMCSRRVTMQGRRIIVEEAPLVLDAQALLERLPTNGCGAIVSFVGITREYEQGHDVLRLEFDAWKDRLVPVLQQLAEEAIETFNVKAVALAHRTGPVGPQEPIVAIHVASPHRKEGFEACSWLIDELKRQAPIWKKEVTTAGETWKEGLG